MRYATVAWDGTYNRVALHEKVLYGGMLDARFFIIHHSAFQLAQALTIATRYSIVHEQAHSAFSEDSAEVPIIHFKSQHYRLLIFIAKAEANLFTFATSVVTNILHQQCI